jgi:hypothetical protein
VTLDGRALRDDAGPFLALGATLFWALWGERHDPGRLDANLAWLAERGVDYVRILGMVGGDGWDDRAIDPSAPDYWDIVDRLVARLARHHLRAQITIFAGAHVMMPEPAARNAFVDAWAARVNRDPDRFMLVEIANEHYQNGLEDVAEVRALGRRLAERTPVLIALSAPAGHEACALYAGAGADLATIHYARDNDRPWETVDRPWTFPREYDAGCRGRLPPAINNEPIGPGSSVAGDADPLRLAMAYVMTFVAGNAAYVIHTGAGVRGGGSADRSRGRQANVFDVAGLDEALRGIQLVRERLPDDLASWDRVGVDEPDFPIAGLSASLDSGALAGAYAVRRDGNFVAVVLGLQRPLEGTARHRGDIEIVNPLQPGEARRFTVRHDAPIRVAPVRHDASGDGLVLIGR